MSANQHSGVKHGGTGGATLDANTLDLTLKAVDSILDNKLTSMKSCIVSVFEDSLKSLKDELTSLHQSLKFLCNEYDDLKKDHHEQKQVICSLKKENTALSQKLDQISGRLQSIEQLSRSNNIEFQGVPEKKNENVVGIVKKIYEVATGEMISDESIMSCRRVAKLDPTTSRPRNILLTLPSPRHRDHLLSAVHRYNKANQTNKLNTHSIDIAGEKSPVYVVEHLPPETKSLQAEARKIAKEKNYTFVWVKYGKVFVRKCENAKAIMVKNEQSLKLIV